MLVSVVVSGLLQLIGVASIFPFIAVASDVSVIERNEYLSLIVDFLQLSEPRDLVTLLGILVFILIVISNAFISLTIWITHKFVFSLFHDVSERLLSSFISEDYLFHISINSSELINTLTNEIIRAIQNFLKDFIELLAHGFTAFTILLLLLFVDPVVALSVGVTLASVYALILKLLQRRIKESGEELESLYASRLRVITEALRGIKEVKLLAKEKEYLAAFKHYSTELKKRQVFAHLSFILPRYVLESLAFGGIVIITIYFVSITDNFQMLLPTISLYALAGYRLMPAMQGVYKSISGMRLELPALESVLSTLEGYSDESNKEASMHTLQQEDINIQKQISFRDLVFVYPNTSVPAIHELTWSIEANSTIGIVGSSGSGKSTLADILLGFLTPTSGDVLVDEQKIDKNNVRNWQKLVGYVPQKIFIVDDTIASNIAFGTPKQEIDMSRVVEAAKKADLHSYVASKLDEQYDTIVGESGVRLSGGQRQRIGIARALYNNPQVLIFDEATSALDNRTEANVMNAIYNMKGERTIIMIAHRLSTIRNCDQILWLESGKMMLSDDYDNLSKNAEFKKFTLSLSDDSD